MVKLFEDVYLFGSRSFTPWEWNAISIHSSSIYVHSVSDKIHNISHTFGYDHASWEYISEISITYFGFWNLVKWN